MPIALLALFLGLLFAQPADGVSVSTDMTVYGPGDDIQVTTYNAGPNTITRGGIVCDAVWPLAIDQLQPDGSWQALPVPPRGNCVGVAAILIPPGASQTRTLSLALDPGTYRVVYAFDIVGSGPAPNTRSVAYSDPFDVNP